MFYKCSSKQSYCMAKFYYYGTLKLVIELKSVLTVAFIQGWFPRLVARILRFFEFDSTYQSAEENLANLHYKIVKLDGPSVYTTSFKISEISCHLANNRENFMRQVFLYHHSDHGKSWLH